MQNTRRTIEVITLFTIFCFAFSASAQKPRELVKVYENAGENKNHKADREYWMSIGFEKGKKIGDKEGYARGKEAGIEEGYERGVNKAFDNMDSSWLYYTIPLALAASKRDFDKMKEIHEKNGGRNGEIKIEDLQKHSDGFWMQFGKNNSTRYMLDLYRQSVEANVNATAYDSTLSRYREIRAKVYNEGWRNGFQTAYNIHLKQGQNVTLKEIKLPSALDYVQLVEDIHVIQGKSIYEDATTFSNLIKKVHVDMIDYLSLRLDLSETERRDALVEYDSIHPLIASQYYEKYLSIYRSWGIEAENKSDFYNYHFYHTTHSLIDVISSGLCSVADVCLTYSKSNSQYAAIVGLETGNVCWVLREDYLQTIYYNLLKVAFSRDLNTVVPEMQSSIRQSLSDFNAESQIHKKTVTKVVPLSEGEEAEITMEITSVYNTGFELSDISVEADHKKQNVNVKVARTPRLLGIIQQQGRVLKVITRKEYTQTKEIEKTAVGIKPIFRGEEKIYDKDKKETKKIAEVTVSEKVFNQILEENKPTEEEIKKEMKKLPLDAYQGITTLLKKVVEPAVSLPNTNYKTTFKYGGKKFNIAE